jgi:MoaA/NifB/PqqE/SkfB family radical SAM enzyme
MRNVYPEVTRECPLNCNFCSLGGDRKPKHSEAELRSFLKMSFEGGCRKVYVTGGEPLQYPRLEKFVRYAVGLGFEEISVQTNGIYMTKEKAAKLKEAGLGQATFSIHSHIPEMEDEIMGGKDVLKRQLRGLVNANEAGINTPVTFVIIRQNYRILPKFVEFISDNYPMVDHFTLNFVDPEGRAKDNREVVPKLSDVEPFLIRALFFLDKSGKTFRVERVPLCYMTEFAEYSTELRRMTTGETNFAKRNIERISYTPEYFQEEYVRAEACKSCWLNKVCPGLKDGYADIYGTGELFPVFLKPELIVRRAGED